MGAATTAPHFIEVNLHDDALRPMAGYPYKIVFDDGTIKEGVLDTKGHARVEGVPNQGAQVYFGDSPKSFSPQAVKSLNVTDELIAEDLRKLGLNPETTNLQALVEREAGRSA